MIDMLTFVFKKMKIIFFYYILKYYGFLDKV